MELKNPKVSEGSTSRKMLRNVSFSAQVGKLIKYLGSVVFRGFLHVRYAATPTIDNQILLESYLGTRLDGNPKAVFDFLQSKYPGKYQFIWAAENPDEWSYLLECPNTQIVRYRSSDHRKAACISKFLIADSPRPNDLPTRRQQVAIQTWHGGGCYKKVGVGVNGVHPVNNFITRRQFRKYTYFVSSSKYFSDEVIRNQYLYRGIILPIGMPRNDELINGNEAKRAEVRAELGLQDDDYFVLYAPTWRDFGSPIPLFDADKVKAGFQEKYGRHVVLGKRGHYFSLSDQYPGFDINLDSYRCMQDLLLVCDAVISDYSSVIWDFSFTYRPCFLFVPDLYQYQAERGLDVDIIEWGFPVCRTEKELLDSIVRFDVQEFTHNMEQHHANLGSYESGAACERVAELLVANGGDHS